MYDTKKYWYVNEDTLSCNFKNYVTRITSGGDNNFRIFRVEIWSDNRFIYSYFFNTLEEALEFCETMISKCRSYEDVIESYDKYKLIKRKE